MKTTQIIFLGLALFLAIQSATCNHCANCGLGPGTDGCGCSELIVKAAKQIRPVKFADPYVIKGAIAAKTEQVSRGCGYAPPQRKINGPSVHELLKFNGPIAPRFQPVGDLCSGCQKSITEVIPAYPGKPVCRACAARRDESCDDPNPEPLLCGSSQSRNVAFTSLSAPDPELNVFDTECPSFDDQERIYNSVPVEVPADAVSLSLAYGLSRQSNRHVSEAGLIYGPNRTPIDGSIRKKINNFPEEKLFIVDKPIVELQSPARTAVDYREEIMAQQEALEARRLELEAQFVGESQARGPTYSELGYGLSKSTGTNFVTSNIQSNSGYEDDSINDSEDNGSPCGPIGKPIPGYISGNVIVRQEADQQSDAGYYGEATYDQGSSDEQDDYDDGSSSEESESSNKGSGLLARLRASALVQNGYKSSCGCYQ